MAALDQDLDELQREVFQHDLEASGPVLIASSPGTGKTTVLARRIARKILDGMPPERVLGLTLTTYAAHELRSRVSDILCRAHFGTAQENIRHLHADPTADAEWREASAWVASTTRRMRVMTFHSLALFLLRSGPPHAPDGARLGLPGAISVADRGAAERLATRVILDAEGDPTAPTLESPAIPAKRAVVAGVAELLAEADLVRCRGASVRAVAGEQDRRVAEFLRLWREVMHPRGLVALAELPLLATELLERHPDLLAKHRGFDEILLDEFQDTTRAQFRLIQLLAGARPRVIAAGDTRQAVQTTLGSETRFIERFQEYFPAARIVRLAHNYRFAAPLGEVSRSIFIHAPDADSHAAGGMSLASLRRFRDQDEEAAFVAAEIFSLLKDGSVAKHSDIAILLRRQEHSDAIRLALARAGIPFLLAGHEEFWTLPEIRSAGAALALASAASGIPHPVGVMDDALRLLSPDAQHALSSQARTLPHGMPLDAAVDALFAAAGFPRPDPADPAAARSHRNVDHLRMLIRNFSAGAALWPQALPQLEIHLEQCRREARSEELPEREAVRILTVHAAKGLEWDTVFVPCLEDGIFPAASWCAAHLGEEERDFHLEEERRLFYVALTRPRSRLYLTFAHSRADDGRVSWKAPSRFLKELPEDETEWSDGLAEIAPAERWKMRIREIKDWFVG